MVRKIIIDTDPGIDDAMAIHYAFAHPRLDVLGLTSIFGNVHTTKATRNALILAEMAAYPCAVAHGAEAPLVQPLKDPADFVHGAEGFGDILPTLSGRVPDSRGAAAFICETAAADPGGVTVVALGPLTNLALALQHDPTVARNVRDVIVMGGALDVPGNVSPVAEANIWNDPHAADAVFAADWLITMVGLDVTTVVNCLPADFASLRQAAPIIGGFLDKAVQFYFDFHRRQHEFDGCYMHDPTSLIAGTDPDTLNIEEIPIQVITDGPEIGRTTRAEGDRRPVRVCTGVQAKRVRDIFLDTIRTADDKRKARMTS